MPKPKTDPTQRATRFARYYSDGSFSVCRTEENEATAIRLLSGSADDDDTQLVEVEIKIVRWLAHKKLTVVRPANLMREALEAIQSEVALTGHLAELVETALQEIKEDTHG